MARTKGKAAKRRRSTKTKSNTQAMSPANGSASGAMASDQSQVRTRAQECQRQLKKEKASEKRRRKVEGRLHEIIPGWCKIPPGSQISNIWYGIVRYKDYLTGQNTPTAFDEADAGKLSSSRTAKLGRRIRDELLLQLPVEFRQTSDRFEVMAAMAENQMEQIVRLQERNIAGNAEQQFHGHRGGEDSGNEVAEEEALNENDDVIVKEEDDDQDAMFIEEGPESSCHEEEEEPIQNPGADAAHFPIAVKEALEIVKGHVVRASHADWDNPHAAVVWGQVVSEDLAKATARLRAAIASQNP